MTSQTKLGLTKPVTETGVQKGVQNRVLLCPVQIEWCQGKVHWEGVERGGRERVGEGVGQGVGGHE